MLAPVSPMSIHVGYFGMADGLLTQEYVSRDLYLHHATAYIGKPLLAMDSS